MAKTIGTFTYRLIAPREDDMPFNAITHIGLQRWSNLGDDWPILSPQLMTEGEIDYHINAYKEDLDRVGRLAKRALKRANEKTRAESAAWVARRKAKGSN